MKRNAMYPGTFDPITNGHQDLVRRAAGVFDRVIVAIAANPNKAPMFPLDQRVTSRGGCSADHARMSRSWVTRGSRWSSRASTMCTVVVRGLRAVSDFEFEFQLANMSRHLAREIETVFLTPQEQFTFISSTLVREIAVLGGDVKEFVHPIVDAELKKMKRV